MIATSMVYSIALGFLIGLGALALERVARLAGRPARFLWAAAVAASLLVPSAAVVLRGAPAPRSTVPPTSARSEIQPAALPAPAGSAAPPAVELVGRMTAGLSALDVPLLILWGGASLLLGLGVIRAVVAIRRRARDWAATHIAGTPVLLAPDVGPAVVRLRGLVVVLPTWAQEAEPDARSLMLRHEREHCAARDPDLLLGATLALVLMPWNPALWWQVRRLQLAVETDCDRRVMGAGADVHAYGSLLLAVGARHAWTPLLAASSFAETPSLLTRRIETMIAPEPRHPAARAAAATGVALLALLLVGMVPRPAPMHGASPRTAHALATGARRACTDTMGIQLSVTREAGAVTVAEQDLAALARSLVGEHGYAPQVGPAAVGAPTRLDVSLTLQAGSAHARATVSRAGVAGTRGASGQTALPADAGAATVGSMLGGTIQLVLGDLPLGNCVDWSTFASELRTPAVMEAVRRHAAEVGGLPRAQDAGLWLVQDSAGNHISSGVLTSFPTGMNSANYKAVVPGASATGQDAISFGFAHTPAAGGLGPFRLVYVTVARRP